MLCPLPVCPSPRATHTGRDVRRGAAVIALAMALVSTPGFASTNYNAGLSLVVALGPISEQARVGIGLDGTIQWFDHPRPYYSDVPNRVGPLTTLGLHVIWLRPNVTSAVTGAVGLMYPATVYDLGFVSGIGLQAHAGLAMSTDGSAGPVLGAVLVGPWSEARLEVTYWRGWHAPRLAIGPQLTLSGYGTYD